MQQLGQSLLFKLLLLLLTLDFDVWMLQSHRSTGFQPLSLVPGSGICRPTFSWVRFWQISISGSFSCLADPVVRSLIQVVDNTKSTYWSSKCDLILCQVFFSLCCSCLLQSVVVYCFFLIIFFSHFSASFLITVFLCLRLPYIIVLCHHLHSHIVLIQIWKQEDWKTYMPKFYSAA